MLCGFRVSSKFIGQLLEEQRMVLVADITGCLHLAPSRHFAATRQGESRHRLRCVRPLDL